jgi:hypothetical protein
LLSELERKAVCSPLFQPILDNVLREVFYSFCVKGSEGHFDRLIVWVIESRDTTLQLSPSLYSSSAGEPDKMAGMNIGHTRAAVPTGRLVRVFS